MILMSFRPRPADSVHRKRAFRVSAPPPGWLPSVVSLPGGRRRRPLGWSRDAGPTSFVGTTAPATPAATAATAASGTPLRNLTGESSHPGAARVSPAREPSGAGILTGFRGYQSLESSSWLPPEGAEKGREEFPATRIGRGWALTGKAWQILEGRRRLWILPAIAALLVAIAATALAVPGAYLLRGQDWKV